MVTLMAALLLAGCGAKQPAAEPAPATEPAVEELEVGPFAGYRAPELEAFDLYTNEAVSLEDLRGKPVLLNFWATWCPPCEEEMPDLQQVHDELEEKAHVITVGGDPFEEADKIERYFSRLQLTLPAWVDNSGAAVKAYRSYGLPTSYFIDADGVIQHVHIGALTYEQMLAGLALAGLEVDE